jgi:hypothetical protein
VHPYGSTPPHPPTHTQFTPLPTPHAHTYRFNSPPPPRTLNSPPPQLTCCGTPHSKHPVVPSASPLFDAPSTSDSVQVSPES